ncbi:unnamed protein product [Vitrella brassicaformis CCMP3155]|uniref:PPM-type phosphatase domain-containing protein n=1 Tax=Vitrella brassicaformis (strain CCMP3155) TaxID=1169540 RepID=A0A0G4GAP7_VITBC|nr:unnamed protein product [Vitrella brassicaformis CCMP3155]|eukprot:CEM25870.1 unnamed protein product [Vitrella brassicaformis CCMP3155]
MSGDSKGENGPSEATPMATLVEGAAKEGTIDSLDVGPVDLVLKCTKGLFQGRFIYVNRTPQGEVFGSDRSSNEITMYIENANLSLKHAEIKYVERNQNYFLKDAQSDDGTFVKVQGGRRLPIRPSQRLTVDGHEFEIITGDPFTEEAALRHWLIAHRLNTEHFESILSARGLTLLPAIETLFTGWDTSFATPTKKPSDTTTTTTTSSSTEEGSSTATTAGAASEAGSTTTTTSTSDASVEMQQEVLGQMTARERALLRVALKEIRHFMPHPADSEGSDEDVSKRSAWGHSLKLRSVETDQVYGELFMKGGSIGGTGGLPSYAFSPTAARPPPTTPPLPDLPQPQSEPSPIPSPNRTDPASVEEPAEPQDPVSTDDEPVAEADAAAPPAQQPNNVAVKGAMAGAGGAATAEGGEAVATTDSNGGQTAPTSDAPAPAPGGEEGEAKLKEPAAIITPNDVGANGPTAASPIPSDGPSSSTSSGGDAPAPPDDDEAVVASEDACPADEWEGGPDELDKPQLCLPVVVGPEAHEPFGGWGQSEAGQLVSEEGASGSSKGRVKKMGDNFLRRVRAWIDAQDKDGTITLGNLDVPSKLLAVSFQHGSYDVCLWRCPPAQQIEEPADCWVRLLPSQLHCLRPGDIFKIGSLEFTVLRFNTGIGGEIGFRATMEDEEIALQELDVSDRRHASFFAVYDGHGGRDCAEYVRRHLHLNFIERIQRAGGLDGSTNVHKDIVDAIKYAFLKTDSDFLHRVSSGPAHTGSGCAAVCVVVVGGHIWCANCGDSRAVLCRAGQALNLSHDHKPDRVDEHKRIEAAGGFVSYRRVLGRLAVSRAFGDYDYKCIPKRSVDDPNNDEGPAGPLVISEPEIRHEKATSQDEFVLLACDGLFDVFSSQEAVQFVRTRLAEMPRNEQDPHRVVQDLIHEAIHNRRSRDNVTAILLTFKRYIHSHPPQHQTSSSNPSNTQAH